MTLPLDEFEAGPQALAQKFLRWLRQRGYELPGEVSDWYLLKCRPSYGATRRTKYDIERGVMAWYLTYTGTDEEARHWSGTFGGDIAPSTLLNKLDSCELVENTGYNELKRYRFNAGLKLTFSEKVLVTLPPKMKTFYIWKCSHCGYRTEDSRRNFGERYVHGQCGQDSRYELVDTVKVEVARTS